MIWIMKIPVLCTSHMPTSDALDHISEPVARTDDGGFVYLTKEYEYLSDWLRPIQQWATQRGFDWVRFDSAGDVIDLLPVYEWPDLEGVESDRAFEPQSQLGIAAAQSS